MAVVGVVHGGAFLALLFCQFGEGPRSTGFECRPLGIAIFLLRGPIKLLSTPVILALLFGGSLYQFLRIVITGRHILRRFVPVAITLLRGLRFGCAIFGIEQIRQFGLECRLLFGCLGTGTLTRFEGGFILRIGVVYIFGLFLVEFGFGVEFIASFITNLRIGVDSSGFLFLVRWSINLHRFEGARFDVFGCGFARAAGLVGAGAGFE
mmetsp:Transcript_35050/g.40558  ORF Transcript_35050/g.40558 Transcript_35050/m.40558 type:complete len:208 (-) Transcript_35050:90-713(-)